MKLGSRNFSSLMFSSLTRRAEQVKLKLERSTEIDDFRFFLSLEWKNILTSSRTKINGSFSRWNDELMRNGLLFSMRRVSLVFMFAWEWSMVWNILSVFEHVRRKKSVIVWIIEGGNRVNLYITILPWHRVCD